MKFTIKTGSPEKAVFSTLVLGVFGQGALPAQALVCDQATQGLISKVIKRGDLEDKPCATLLLPNPFGISAQRVLLVNLGSPDDWSDKVFRDAIRAVAKAVAKLPTGDLALCPNDFTPPRRSASWCAENIAQILVECAYQFEAPWTHDKVKAHRKHQGTHEICLLFKNKPSSDLENACKRGRAIGHAVNFAKNLGNLPGNICTPSYLAETARSLAKSYEFKLDVLDRTDVAKLGMGAFLSVTNGSAQEPKFIVMQYKGGKSKSAPVVLVGKGITFDSGGISLKPGPEMDEMKFDMCGAASVLGVFKMLGELSPPINVAGIIPATENMPGGRATKPGDIVTSMSGQTIEILNTDAEGRLVLCDALTYAERFKPTCVIDIATLTGACVIALGKIPSGLMSNDDALAVALLQSAHATGDRAWQLPLWEEYQDLLKSNFADMANIGGRYAGAITAAAFLARFTKNYPWAHLDIAGTAWISGESKGATGRPVSLLSHFLLERAGN